MGEKTAKLLSVLKLQPVVPVLIVEDAKSAVPLARALVAGGLKAIEITLRTAGALDAIRAVADEVEGASSALARRRSFSTPPARRMSRYCRVLRPQAKSWRCGRRVIRC